MATFHLKIVTPDRMVFDGDAERIVIRTVAGDVCILAKHIDYTAPIGIGQCHVVDAEGKSREAAVSGGILTVYGGEVMAMATTFEWSDEINLSRAEKAQMEAEEKLKILKRDDREFAVASAKLKRAINRINVAK
ncbi:MAG: ATP synthase F1 subunit epsilon [Clostridiales bacterium]|nr:ATP synthase F1 subunit epsilon [Clostridiales bacterium]